MEADLRKQFDANITLVAGSGGIFDINVDGKVVFSKSQTGRFPESNEIIELMQKL